ncbi:hypothetical protein [Streptomyces sp. V4I2]|uniref:hypothetical protein n=1 Tax=Streptomyces sp. V4I2 TaxID=3042280 RepID=UPI00278B6B42|nr:hypothetical protein [Streptomyces sp. V4I2]MDQ1042796.1 hypothetical protein [Streptomyces sp. V4I2]
MAVLLCRPGRAALRRRLPALPLWVVVPAGVAVGAGPSGGAILTPAVSAPIYPVGREASLA